MSDASFRDTSLANETIPKDWYAPPRTILNH